MKKILFSILIPVLLLSFVHEADAQIRLHPSVINETAKVRDGFDFTITVENETRSNIRVYPIVFDITPDEGRIFPQADPETNSLGSWIEISRNRIELGPGDEEEIPMTLRVDSKARPGSHNAVVVFAQGNTLDLAERNALRFSYPEVLINITVEEDIVERLQLLGFYHEKESFWDSSVDFFLNIENIGNTELKPKGLLVIYKSKQGKELESLIINEDGRMISPGSQELFENEWRSKGSFGQHKAVLMMEYGDETKRDIYDTVYFWVVPEWFLAALGIGTFILILLIFLLFKKRRVIIHPEYQGSSAVLDLSRTR